MVQFCWEREAIKSAKCKTHPVMQQGALSNDGAKCKITTQNLKREEQNNKGLINQIPTAQMTGSGTSTLMTRINTDKEKVDGRR